MTDPFHDLREPITPADPDPVFARRLRARVERALALPRGVVPVTATALRPADTPPAAAPRPAAVPYLAVADARAAIDWYAEVLGAEPVGEPIVMPDGRIGHAELNLGGGVLYLSDAYPEIGVTAPRPGEASVSLMLPVDDADAVRERAMARGASGDRPPYDAYGSRNAWVVDPFGHRWGLNSPLGGALPAPAFRHGDVVHVAHVVPDVERARSFYAAVLGWTYLPDGRVDGSYPSVGFRAGDVATITVAYAVGDLDAARAAVDAAGGSAGPVERYEWGTVAECLDDQGMPFRLHELDVAPADAPAPGSDLAGDLSYLSLHVEDSARARAFYGSVLGWAFTGGRVADGWSVDRVAPPAGLAGGADRGTAVPQWFVTDLDGALQQVRANGGRAGDPESRPYGLSALCTDDQGLEFYVLQVS